MRHQSSAIATGKNSFRPASMFGSNQSFSVNAVIASAMQAKTTRSERRGTGRFATRTPCRSRRSGASDRQDEASFSSISMNANSYWLLLVTLCLMPAGRA